MNLEDLTPVISANQKTLRPAEGVDPRDLPAWKDDPEGASRRYLLTFLQQHELTDEWQEVTLFDYRKVEIRAAACGADCRCAGEFRWVEPEPRCPECNSELRVFEVQHGVVDRLSYNWDGSSFVVYDRTNVDAGQTTRFEFECSSYAGCKWPGVQSGLDGDDSPWEVTWG